MLELTEVEGVTPEALSSLTSFGRLEHLSISGRKVVCDMGGQHWPNTHDWRHVTALRAIKHLELDHIDHTVGICTNLVKLTKLTHFASMQNVYRQDMQRVFLSLGTLPHLHLLHCSFACYKVHSTYASDLENNFTQQRGSSIPTSKLS